MNTTRPLSLLVLVVALLPTGGSALAAALPAGVIPADLPPFTAIYYTGATPSRNPVQHVALFTPRGPIAGTIQPGVFNVSHVAVDPRGQVYFGGGDRRLPARFDPLTGVTTPLPDPDPELSWPTGLTFDTTRNRLILSSLGGEGFLYAYSPKADRWTTLRSLNNVDLHSITYSAKDDAFYALSSSQLLRYDAEGRPAGSIRLDPSLPSGLDLFRSQLVATGDRLVLLTQPVADLLDPRLPAVQRSYLIDPRTGTMTALGPISVVPEPGAAALCLLALGGVLLRRRAKPLSDE